jgi:integrase
LWIPLHPELLAIIDATPSEHLTFIVSEHGKPFASSRTLSQRIRTWAREAGLTGCPLHGLRKVCLRRLAEAGCTAPEIMAISGHKSMAEVQKYIKNADQKLMAERAIARTVNYPQSLCVGNLEKKA